MEGPNTVRLDPMTLAPFEILEEAGAGGMGTVYRARDRESGLLLAVKVLKEKSGDITRFALEADVLSKLRHPNIVAYAHHGITPDDHIYLAMEWLEGESLEQRLARGTLSIEEMLPIARAIVNALVVAHEAGVIHRDLKPSNVFVTTEGAIKLLDFGIAKSRDVEGLTGTGDALGTPGYMSPEQARGQAVDARSDLFSLGCLMFRSVGGRRPFAGSDLMAFATALALDPPARLRDVVPDASGAVETLILRLLAKNPAARPPTSAAVRDAIDCLIDSERLPAGFGDAVDDPSSKVQPVPEAATVATVANTAAPAPAASPELLPPATELVASIPTRKVSSLRRPLLVVIALAALSGAPFLFTKWRPEQDRATSPAASLAVATAASVRPSTPGPLLADEDRSGLTSACREWASVLVRSQRADGSFAGDAHAEVSGWDTAQQLYALALSKRACTGAEPASLAAGARALQKLRSVDGWVGARPAPPFAGRKNRPSETPGAAWALLALSALAEGSADSTVAAPMAEARADLLRARGEDGGFRHLAREPGPSTIYSTVLAAWALQSADLHDGGARSPEAGGARAWIRKAVGAGSEATRVPGMTEQIAWILARDERGAVASASSQEAIRALAKEALAHCELRDGRCVRPQADTGKVSLGGDAGVLVTLWHPWASLAAFELAREPSRSLDSETRDGLAAISRWGFRALREDSRAFAAMPEYKLAEYLIAVALALELR